MKKSKAPEQSPPAAPVTEYFEPGPNKMFAPQLTALLRFARTKDKSIRCAMCNKRPRTFWTMLCPFEAHVFPEHTHQFSMPPGKEFPPLTLVCDDHLLNPTKPIQAAL